MSCVRLSGLGWALVCLGVAATAAFAQQDPAPAKQNPFEPARPSSQQAPSSQGQSPFEPARPPAPPAKPETPAEPEPAKQAPSPFEQPPAAPRPEAAKPAAEDVIEAIEFRGARRVPQDTLRAMIFTKRGDKIDPDSLRRDFMALWNTGRYDDIRVELEPGATGQILRFMLTERQVVRSITYPGIKSITISEILDRFKERRVGLSIESMYDPSKVQRARVVLQEFLAERGRQFAEVTPEIRQLPPSSLAIAFHVNEGAKVKVGKIDIEGNPSYKDRTVIRSMRGLRPIGVPYSIFLENIFTKAYDSTKLDMDMELLRDFYQRRGYFTARALDHKVQIRDVGGGKFRVPPLFLNRPGKRADVSIQVEEGRRYVLNKVNYTGVKVFRTTDFITTGIFRMQPGEYFSTEKLRKGLEEFQKYYGSFGYIDFVPEPSFDLIPNTNKLDLTINVDEGKQFFVRRIDFSGNTTTRDKVIRRELLIDEGDMFSSRMWELSILRLNQLGYFEALKEKEAADIKRDTRNSTVDITLKVKERGKNSIGLQGGVSGIAGSFIGFNYSTNNFLGLGETLSVETQFGDRIRSATLGFTEPYLFDRPISTGFTIYMQRFNFDQGREVSLLSGRNLLPLYSSLGTQNLLNYVSNGRGFTVFTSYPLRRTFARIGLTYGYDISNITVLTNAAKNYFDYLNFQQAIAGPNSLTGIRTSKVIPSYTYNTVDHPITPSRGKSFFFSVEYAGGPLGGNVNLIRPTFSTTYFRRGFWANHVIGMRGMVSFLTGYGGKLAPPFNRFYMGGEQDVRGFEIWGITPWVFVPSVASINVLNDDGSARTQKVIVDGKPEYHAVYQTIPTYQLTMAGGDTQAVGNFEYRIPLVGPVNLALFFDAGVNKILRPNQLTLTPDRIGDLNRQFPQAGFDGRAIIAPGLQKMRTSTGIEFQVMMPVVNAPFRLYWAYNPTRVFQVVQPPIVADRSFFPNQATFINAVTSYGQPFPWLEKSRTIRFTIGRTF
ncbi:MAG: outer membrane protein assembly factor BamA [Bryobacterales bacterium]|nr:outer membrane protein assembly factor BamA [Bryobacterales bacterium]